MRIELLTQRLNEAVILFDRKISDEDFQTLCNVWYNLVKGRSDKAMQAGFNAYFLEGTYFPKPADILERPEAWEYPQDAKTFEALEM